MPPVLKKRRLGGELSDDGGVEEHKQGGCSFHGVPMHLVAIQAAVAASHTALTLLRDDVAARDDERKRIQNSNPMISAAALREQLMNWSFSLQRRLHCQQVCGQIRAAGRAAAAAAAESAQTIVCTRDIQPRRRRLLRLLGPTAALSCNAALLNNNVDLSSHAGLE